MPVQKERITEQFKTLVSFDSESFHERKIADYLKKSLEEIGLEVSEDNAAQIFYEEGLKEKTSESAGNIYGILHGNTDGPAILFSSHMDTVSPGKGKKTIIHEDGTITSDNSTVLGADDAGGLSAILEMLRVIEEERIPHPDIEVIFPVAEEPYAQGSRVFDYSKVKSKIAYVPDLSGELGTAAFAAPTILSFGITVKGKSAHAGFSPQDGIHAILIASEAIASLPSGWVHENLSLNIGTINGGSGTNIVPDNVRVTGEIRGMEHSEVLELSKRVKEAFEKASAKYGGKSEYTEDIKIESYRTPLDSEVSKRFDAACRKNGIESPKFIKTFGGSDNNNFAKHGISGLVIASAMYDVHTTHEYTRVEDLVKLAGICISLAT